MVSEITGSLIAKNVGVNLLCGVASGVGTMVGAVIVLAAIKKFNPELLGGKKTEVTNKK